MKTSRITVRLTDEDRARLEQLANRKDIPIAQIVRSAIENYLKENNSNGSN